MPISVTAVLVAHQGGEWLEQTLAGLAAQTRRPDRVVAINAGGPERVSEQLGAGGVELVVGTEGRLAFGAAVRTALGAAPEVEAGVDEWVWLLSEDSCPEPDALAHILGSVQRAPSVAIAGPKLVDWDRPERIIELGQSLTHYGGRWTLRRQELDQQQYDHLQDVLGVGPVGMLVRRSAWDELEGFDPALPVTDDGLDLCVRARLAGYRVVVAPASRVRFAQSGVAGSRIDRKRSVMRAAHRRARLAQLHRRIAYAPAVFAFFMWLGLPLYGLARMLWSLIREQPGQMLGEMAAAIHEFFRPGAIIASRRRIRRHRSAGWAAVRPLRIDPKSVRTARMIDREIILAAQGRRPRELHFVSAGGLGVLVAALVLAVVLCWWMLPHTSLVGGGLAPLSPFEQLWRATRTVDGVPADPFAWVLAVLGTLTFWNPSHAIVLFAVAAIPLAALGGWIWAAQVVESRAGRALIAIGWAVSPVLLGSLSAGRLPTLVLAVVLPWLLLAAVRCRESWSWAGTTSLLAAVALACAPSLMPAAVIALVVGMFSLPRGAARVLTTAIAPAALFLPNIVTAVLQGRPLDLLLDPGIAPAYHPGTTWHLMLGFPEFGLEGWAAIFDGIGLGELPATLLVGVLLLPIALLALLGIFTGRVTTSLFSAGLGGLGLFSAVLGTQLRLTVEGSESVALWTGSGLAVYWIALLTLAAGGAETLRRAAAPVVSIALIAATIAVAPLGFKQLTAQTPVTAGHSRLPALVEAEGNANPGMRTLVLTASGEHVVRARTIQGAGVRLDQLRTAAETPEPTDADAGLAELVGALASSGATDAAQRLADERISFVLLEGAGDGEERAELQAVFDRQSALTSIGNTSHGLLWRAVAASPGVEEGDAERQLTGTTLGSRSLWWGQAIVVLCIALLALPTGEVVERPARRKRPGRWKRGGGAAGAVAAIPAGAAVAAAGEPGAAVSPPSVPPEPAEADAAGGDPDAAGRDPDAAGGDPERAEGDPDAAEEDPERADPHPEPTVGRDPDSNRAEHSEGGER